MEIWFKASNSDKFMLPVNPESFSFTEKHNNTSVVVNSLGEVNLLGKRGLKEGTISSFFPNRNYNFGQNSGRKKPYDYVNRILKWKQAGTPVRVIIGGSVNLQMSIETFKYGEQDGTGDVYFDITLKEYRAVTVKKTKLKEKKKTSKKKTTKKRTTENKPKTKTYTVKSGDCLWNIAKKYYGNGAQYTKIYNANLDKIKNPNLIYPGQVFKIP